MGLFMNNNYLRLIKYYINYYLIIPIYILINKGHNKIQLLKSHLYRLNKKVCQFNCKIFKMFV